MRFGTTFFVLVYLFLRPCNGSPPGEDGKKSDVLHKYTAQEDQFIIDELLSFPVDEDLQIYSKPIWDHIYEEHIKKVQQNTPGFARVRSRCSLLGRFKNTLRHNLLHSRIKIPEALKQKYTSLNPQKYPGKRGRVYTEEENNLIFDVLLKTSNKNVHALTKAIIVEHNKRHDAKVRGFEIARTMDGMRKHLREMSREGYFPREVLKNSAIDKEVVRWHPYTAEEENVVIQTLLKSPGSSLSGRETLKPIVAEFAKNHEAKIPGFEMERTYRGIQGFVLRMKKDGKLPSDVMKKFFAVQEGGSSSNSMSLPEQTDIEMSNDDEDDDETVADMIDELLNTNIDVDFSQFR